MSEATERLIGRLAAQAEPVRRLRPPAVRAALWLLAVGAVAGMLFFLGERKILDERLLYLVWQPAVAFCIGLGLARQSQGS